MTINEFINKTSKMPTKARRKFIKCFVGKDRQRIYDMLEIENATEKQLMEIWSGE